MLSLSPTLTVNLNDNCSLGRFLIPSQIAYCGERDSIYFHAIMFLCRVNIVHYSFPCLHHTLVDQCQLYEYFRLRKNASATSYLRGRLLPANVCTQLWCKWLSVCVWTVIHLLTITKECDFSVTASESIWLFMWNMTFEKTNALYE